MLLKAVTNHSCPASGGGWGSTTPLNNSQHNHSLCMMNSATGRSLSGPDHHAYLYHIKPCHGCYGDSQNGNHVELLPVNGARVVKPCPRDTCYFLYLKPSDHSDQDPYWPPGVVKHVIVLDYHSR